MEVDMLELSIGNIDGISTRPLWIVHNSSSGRMDLGFFFRPN